MANLDVENKKKISCIFGCDINGWTKDRNSSEMVKRDRQLKKLIHEGLEKVCKNGEYNESKGGDGILIAFTGNNKVVEALDLASFLSKRRCEVDFSIGIAIMLEETEFFTDDSDGKTYFSGLSPSDTKRLVDFSKNWRIAGSPSYIDELKNCGDLKHLKFIHKFQRDKHRHKHEFYFIEGYYNEVILGVSIEEISDDSILPKNRKNEIAKLYENYVLCGKLHKSRDEHNRRLEEVRKNNCDTNLVEPAWKSIATTDSILGQRLIIGLSCGGCEYRKRDHFKLGCFYCGFYTGSIDCPKTRLESIVINQFRKGILLGRESNGFDVIEFLNDGSFLNDDEMPEEAKKDLFRTIGKMKHIKRVLIESTPEYIINGEAEIIQRLLDLRDDQSLEIGVGFESNDDFVRKYCLNRSDNDRNDFSKSLETINKINKENNKNGDINVVACIIVKPPFLKEKESIDDVFNSFKAISELRKKHGVLIIPKLEPTIVSEGTLQNLLFQNNEYKPVSGWSILEILAGLGNNKSWHELLDKVRVGSRNDMDETVKVPAIYSRDGRFSKFDFVVYRAIQKFNYKNRICENGVSSSGFDRLVRVFAFIEKIFISKKSSILMDREFIDWENDNLNGRSEIRKFFGDHRKEINNACDNIDRNKTEFIGSLFYALNSIEGREEDKDFPRNVISWIEMLSSNPDEVKRFIQEMVDKKIKSTLRYSEFRVVDVCLEKNKPYLLRICFSVYDAITNDIYDVWAGIPTIDYSK
ncbi:MAG: hypothetical protein H7833_05905 [Magnetococcus sp. DMHC-1]